VSFWGRLRLLLRGRAEPAPEEAEDPRETLDRAYARQIQLQQKMRQSVADVVTSRKRIELQSRQLERSALRLEGQARDALRQGHEDLAREALSRRALALSELEDLKEHGALLAAGEAQLLQAARRVDLQVQQFRTRKEAVKSVYTAAQARTRAGESLAGLDRRDDTELLLALQRAENKILDTQARAEALEGLLASGTLQDVSIARGPVYRELAAGRSQEDVAGELARLKQNPPVEGPAQPKPSTAPDEGQAGQ
jgi:phage shock protein A